MAGILSSSNRSQLRYKLEGTYPTNFGVPQGGNGTNLNMTGETLDYSIKTVESKTIRSDRQVPDNIQVGASPQGGFGGEFQYREYDPFIQAVYQSTFAAYGTAGVGSAVALLTFAPGTITAGTAPTGADDFTTLKKGQWFNIKAPVGASASVKQYWALRAFRVSPTVAPTTTVITLAPETQINTTLGGGTMVNGFIRSSHMENGSTMTSYTLELGHDDISQYRQYAGMICSKMDVKLSTGDIVTLNFDFMGKSMARLDATSMGTPVVSQTYTLANATKGIFDIFENGQSISAITYIKSGDFSIDNTLRAQEACGVFGNAGIASGTMRISGKLEVYFADGQFYDKFLNDTSSNLVIPILDIDGNGYVFTFGRIKYKAVKVNAGGLDQDNMLSMEFMAVLDNVSTSPTFQKTIAIDRVGA